MAYTKYKQLSQLTDILGIEHENRPFLPQLQPAEVSERLLLDLQDALMIPLTTEKSKSEHIIVPVLKEFLRKNPDRMSYFSGFQFDVDASKNLSGYCDFILSAKARQLEVTAPIFCLVEAKNAEIKRGLAQCGAEMRAAQIYNQQKGNSQKVVYGCVTNAFSWCFLKLTEDLLVIDSNYIPLTLTNPHQVLAVLQWILEDV